MFGGDKMKRKNIFKSLLAAAMALTMIFGAAPLSGFVGISLPLFSMKAEAATRTTEDGLFDYELDIRGGYYGIRIIRYKGPDSGEVVIPKTIVGFEVERIGNRAFADCTGITSIVIPDGVAEIDGFAFGDCTSLAEITVSPDNQNYSSVDGVLFNKDKSELLAYPIGNSRSIYTVPDGVTKIGDDAFYHCRSLSKVKLSNDLTEIDNFVFTGCTSLEEITMPNSVTEIGMSAFEGCISLSKVKLSNNLTYINEDIFYGCTSLTEIAIPDSVTEIGGSAFAFCTSLREITIPEGVTKIGETVFTGCSSLTDITVSPNNKNYSSVDGVLFSKDMRTLLAYPVGNRRSEYVVPDSVTKIDDTAFRGCSSLTDITVSPNNKNYSSFGGVLFNKSRSKLLKYPIGNERRAYIVPDGVAEIGSSAFDGCTSLEEITIPESIWIIGYYAFNNCSGMKNIYYLGTQEQWRRVIKESWDETLTVHCIDDGHSWGEWEIIEKATFEKEGLKRRVCSLCNAEETRIIPKLVKATKIDLSHNEKTIIVGNTFTITAIVKPEEASNRTVTWSSSDPSIATVDEDGTVTAIAKGEAIITAESTDGIKAECRIIVENESAFAYEINWAYPEEQSIVTITGYKKALAGEVVIPETIEGYKVKKIGGNAFRNCKLITSLVIPSGVTEIGYSAFCDCVRLKEIVIPDSVTEIGSSAFAGCISLTEVVLPPNLDRIQEKFFSGCASLRTVIIPESVEKIDESAFSGCTSLAEIVIPDSVTEIGERAFSGCTSLSKVKLSNNLTKIEYGTFRDCTSLAEITIPDGVTVIRGEWYDYDRHNGAFSGCTSLKEIVIPDSVTGIGEYAFSGCTSLKEIVIPDSVTGIGEYAFSGCTSLAKVKLSNSLTKIGYGAFCDCTSLTGIVIPDSVTKIAYNVFCDCASLTEIVIPDSVTEIGEYAFSDCTSLKEIVIPDSVTEIGEYAFSGCTSLAEITIPNNLTVIEARTFSGCTSLTEIVIPDSVIAIGGYAFSGCTSLAEITIPDNLTIIEVGTFSGCTSLTEIVIPDSVIAIGGYAFYGCTSLAEITIPNNLTIIEAGTFSDCTSLTEIVIPDSVTEIGEYAFSGCTSLAEITIPNNLTIIEAGTFSGCESLTEIVIPDSVTSIGESAFSNCASLAEIVIPDRVTSIGKSALSGCTSLTEIVIPDSVTSIGESAFSGCMSLAEITIPDNLAIIEAGTFSGCTSLTEIVIPDRVTSIGKSAFSGCTGLTEIVIPDSVTEIGEYAFSGCTGLSKVMLSNNLTIIEAGTFSGCTSLTEIVIPDSVTEIIGAESYYNDNGAFSGCTSMKSITIGSGVEELDYSFISFCRGLANINVSPNSKNYSSIDGVLFNKDGTELLAYPGGNDRSEYIIPDGVTKINYEAFSGCTSMKSITIGSGVEELDDSFISFCRRLANINVSPNNKNYSSIDGVLFNKDGSKLLAYPRGNERSKYTIPDGVTTVCKNAFLGCYIKTLTIPVSVTEIESNAFGYSFYHIINDIYYLGTREQWKEVVIGEKNSVITSARLHCADDPPCNHSWGMWEVVEEATYEKDGLERRVCWRCSAEETRKIPKLDIVKVTAIELSDSERTATVGTSFTITATVKPDDALNRTIIWSSSDPSIATVDENGTVTAIAEGEAIITAESADGVKAECKVTVEKAKESFGKKLLNVVTAPFRAIINLFKKLFGKSI